MKISQRKLKQIIKEELTAALSEPNYIKAAELTPEQKEYVQTRAQLLAADETFKRMLDTLGIWVNDITAFASAFGKQQE